jgi:5'-nucleotidase
MHILVTNDDGVHAPGLLALAQEMKKLGEITVLAPDRNWSASGHVKTMHRPLRVSTTSLADGTPALASDGAPSDCVALALLGLVPDKIDIVVSGINPHANIGHDITYSGTVTAAMEAAIGGIPGIAVSLHTTGGHEGEREYGPAARIARRVAQMVLNDGLPRETLLNVNVPHLSDEDIQGIQVTRQGLRVYKDELVVREDPHARPYYWIGGEFPTALLREGTDYKALEDGYVSITPLQLDLTDYKLQDTLKNWQWGE